MIYGFDGHLVRVGHGMYTVFDQFTGRVTEVYEDLPEAFHKKYYPIRMSNDEFDAMIVQSKLEGRYRLTKVGYDVRD